MKVLSHFILVGLLLSFSQFGLAKPINIQGTMTVASPLSMSMTTMQVLKKLKAAGFKIKAKINHQQIAASLGHKIPANQEILFGKPSFEYPLISKFPQAALFVPLVFIIWQDKEGKTYISYWDPKINITPLLSAENDKKIMDDINQMSSTLKQITTSLK